jgi:hypothetical protein
LAVIFDGNSNIFKVAEIEAIVWEFDDGARRIAPSSNREGEDY